MSELLKTMSVLEMRGVTDKETLVHALRGIMESHGYAVAEVDTLRPWGAFIRFANSDGDRFVSEFFEDTNPTEARLGNEQAELSPKLLIVSPGQRLSWQYHHRRAERWKFLTAGGYIKSMTDAQGAVHQARAGEVVQFSASERHRLIGAEDGYTLVAEIWQHTDPAVLSDESDIIRLEDDYRR